jgi:hypothetical protein
MCRSVETTPQPVGIGVAPRTSPETKLDAANAPANPQTESNSGISRRQCVILAVVFLDTLGTRCAHDAEGGDAGRGALRHAQTVQQTWLQAWG